MIDETPLDRAHTAMAAAPGDDAARLQFYERFADGELFLLLAAEAKGAAVEPRIFPLEEGRFALVFDREERLAAFLGAPAPYAALSGRALAARLAGQGVGLGLNLGVAASAILLAPEAVDWLAGTTGRTPDEVTARPEDLRAPAGLPERLIGTIAVKLAGAEGLARHAWLAGVSYQGGRRGHLLVFVDARPGAETALARAANEALIFSGIEAGEIDVAFIAATDPLAAALAKCGLRFDIPVPAGKARQGAPGSDPDSPPRLR